MKLLENKTLLIVGLGLIGGSIARGLSSVPGIRILAHGRDEQALQAALNDKNIHAYSSDLATVAPQADIIMLCTPTLTVRNILEQLKNLIGPNVLVTDAASVKGNIVNDVRRIFPESLHRIVPGHPIAGSEQSGYKASRADLFRNRKVILTPLPESASLAVRTVMQLWQALGADVHGMTPQRHDEVLAGTSHLPHLLAYTLVNTLVDCVSEQDRAQQVFDYAAGGFADFSRIASSDPYMWRDIFLANRDATVDVLDAYISSLGDMRQRLLAADGDGLQFEFERAKRVRDEFIRRFRPSGLSIDDTASSGFVTESEFLLIRPGSSLNGSYRPPADMGTALAALEQSVMIAGVTRLDGYPENMAALSAADRLRAQGVPVVGPEKGVLWVYGSQDAPASAITLPADPFLTGLMVLAAALVPGSVLYLQAVGNTSDELLEQLTRLGARLEMIDNKTIGPELVCIPADLKGNRLDLHSTRMSDSELLLVFAAAAMANGESTILIDDERAQRVLKGRESLFNWAAELDLNVGELRIAPRLLDTADLDLGSDVVLSLLAIVMAQKVKGQLVIRRPGDLAEHYPGLLRMMAMIGFGLEIN